MTQAFEPVKAICAHLNAFHVYASDPSRSVEANHYCTHLSADVRLPTSPVTIFQPHGNMDGKELGNMNDEIRE